MLAADVGNKAQRLTRRNNQAINRNHQSKKAPDGENTYPKDMEELVKKSSFALCHAPVAVRQLVVALQDNLRTKLFVLLTK